MNLVSVNVGLPREIDWRGRRVRTSIWKTPVAGRVRVNRLNLEGDQQSDLSVHGGPEKAVYAVLCEGEVGSGDPIEFTARDDHNVTVADIAALYTHDADKQSLLHRAVDLPALPESWRDYFRKRLWEPDA
jgi:MOSC domain-containing protein YiiM